MCLLSSKPDQTKSRVLLKFMTEAQGTDTNTRKETRVQFTDSRRIVLCLITDSYLECRARLELLFLHSSPTGSVWDLTEIFTHGFNRCSREFCVFSCDLISLINPQHFQFGVKVAYTLLNGWTSHYLRSHKITLYYLTGLKLQSQSHWWCNQYG